LVEALGEDAAAELALAEGIELTDEALSSLESLEEALAIHLLERLAAEGGGTPSEA
jgi:hypothetical protein